MKKTKKTLSKKEINEDQRRTVAKIKILEEFEKSLNLNTRGDFYIWLKNKLKTL